MKHQYSPIAKTRGSKEFIEGEIAFYEGHTVNSVPYPNLSDAWYKWQAGYLCAEMSSSIKGK